MRIEDAERVAIRLVQAFMGLLLALLLFLALVVPYHATDALVYGQLSRMIGIHGGFLIDGVGYSAYARPLFYVPQGWLWWIVGWQEWLGRLAALGFFVLLLWALFRLASDRTLPRVAPWVTLAVVAASPDAMVQAIAGQTDVPVAALISTAAVLLWRNPASARASLVIALVVAAAVLAKATALPALVGLALTCFLGERAALGARLRYGLTPIVGGAALALVYGVAMSRHYGLSLDSFLGGEVTGAGPRNATATTAALPPGVSFETAVSGPLDRITSGVSDFFTGSGRDQILLRAEWLGPYLRIVVIFALIYAIVRLVGIRHKRATLASAAVAGVWYLVSPGLLAGGALPFNAGAGAKAGEVLLFGILVAAAWCPVDAVVNRTDLGRLLLLGLLPLAAWGVFGIIGDTRTLSPTWPSLFVLSGVSVAMGITALTRRRPVFGTVAVIALLAVAFLDTRNVDGLGVRPDGSFNAWSAVGDLTPSIWLDPDAARAVADPQLGGMVKAIDASLAPGATLSSNDGRMIYYAPDRADTEAPPQSCADLRKSDVIAELLNVGESFDSTKMDCLTAVTVVPGSFGVWRVTR